MLYLAGLLAIFIVAAAIFYNRLVRDRNRARTAWSDVDVQLQRRHDLVPRLVVAVDQYADYERSTLEAISALRAHAAGIQQPGPRGDAERELESGMHRLVALAEQYPDLKANDNFLQLQRELVETEDALQYARRFYNGSVRQLNTRIETVPINIVALAFGFRPREFFQKSSDEVADAPRVELDR